MRLIRSYTFASALCLAISGTSPVASAQGPGTTIHAAGARAAPMILRDAKSPGPTDNIGLSAAQGERMRQVFTRLDNQMKPVIARHGARTSQMRNELEAIGSLPPGPKRDQAVRAYQARHDTFYAGLLAESKVDLPALAREFKGIAPDFDFQVQGRSIIGVDARALAEGASLGPQATRPGAAAAITSTAPGTATTPPPAASPTTTRITSFEDESVRQCGVVAGGENRFTNTSVTSNSFAIFAGGCGSEANKFGRLSVPSGRSASISLGYTLRAKAFAVGIAGPSGSDASATVTIGGAEVEKMSVIAVAPLLWAADSEKFQVRTGRIVNVPTGAVTSLRFTTKASSHSIVSAGANSSATVDGISASLTVTP